LLLWDDPSIHHARRSIDTGTDRPYTYRIITGQARGGVERRRRRIASKGPSQSASIDSISIAHFRSSSTAIAR
jgi:hypothetical protein